LKIAKEKLAPVGAFRYATDQNRTFHFVEECLFVADLPLVIIIAYCGDFFLEVSAELKFLPTSLY
jgi:hypothetical protein